MLHDTVRPRGDLVRISVNLLILYGMAPNQNCMEDTFPSYQLGVGPMAIG